VVDDAAAMERAQILEDDVPAFSDAECSE